MTLHYRWVMLNLYGISPILVHGTELGRPDHQSLLIVLVTIASVPEWSLRTDQSRNWSVVSELRGAWRFGFRFTSRLSCSSSFAFGLTKDRHLLFVRIGEQAGSPLERFISISLLLSGDVSGIRDSSIESVIPKLVAHDWRLRHVSPLDRICCLGRLHIVIRTDS